MAASLGIFWIYLSIFLTLGGSEIVHLYSRGWLLTERAELIYCLFEFVTWASLKIFPSYESHCRCVCLLAVLQLFCSSPKAALRYAAVRTLNKVQLHSLFLPHLSRLNFSGRYVEWTWVTCPLCPPGGHEASFCCDSVQLGPGEPDHRLEPQHRHTGYHHSAEDGQWEQRGPTHEADLLVRLWDLWWI